MKLTARLVSELTMSLSNWKKRGVKKRYSESRAIDTIFNFGAR